MLTEYLIKQVHCKNIVYNLYSKHYSKVNIKVKQILLSSNVSYY